jgi:acetylornithine deacetylase/succinyl-diaminopimelate desuccinylase-like protein
MGNTTSVIKLLADLVAIDSQSQVSNEKIIDLLASWFKAYDCTLTSWTRPSDGLKGQNLLVKIPGESSKQSIVFVCHMDTVPTSAAWETNPFILEEQEGKLYGLGACDTKGGVAALLAAVFALKNKPAYDTYILFDGDEEVGSVGARMFLKKGHLPNAHYIFLEPTDGELCIAQRALMKFDITTHGIAMHSSQATPENNIKANAIFKMSHILEILRHDAKTIASETHEHLRMTTQNFGTITGGTARNVSADQATLVMERRLLPHIDPYKEFDRLKRMIIDTVPGTTVVIDEIEPGFATPADRPFIKNVFSLTKSVIPDYKIGAFQAWSEAGLFASLGDVTVLGPGSLIHQAHRANEFVEVQELFQFVEVLGKILTEITV